MAKFRHSTGLERLDEYLGGITDGDHLLVIHGDRADCGILIDGAIRHSSLSDSRAQILSLGSGPGDGFPKSKNVKITKIELTTPKSALREVPAAVASAGERSVVILSGLEMLSSSGLSDGEVLNLFLKITALSKKRKIFLITTILRSDRNLGLIAGLKDSSTICIDLIRFKAELYCTRLISKGRYIQSEPVPLNLTRSVRDLGAGSADPIFENIENRFRDSFYRAQEGLAILGQDGAYRTFNEFFVSISGYEAGELKAIRLSDLVARKDRFSFLRGLASLKGRRSVRLQFDFVRKNRSAIPAEFLVSKIADGWYYAAMRLTEGEQKTVALMRRSLADYESTLEGAKFGVVVLRDGKIEYANREFSRMLGHDDPGEMRGRQIKAYLKPDSNRKLSREIKAESESAPTGSGEAEFIGRTGGPVSCKYQISRVQHGGKKCAQLTLQDVTAEKKNLDELNLRLRLFRKSIENADLPMAVVADEIVKYANGAFFRLIGEETSDRPGRNITSFLNDEEKERFKNICSKVKGGKSKPVAERFTLKRNDGGSIDAVVTFWPVGDNGPEEIIFYFEDRSGKDKIETEIRQRREEIDFLKNIGPAILSNSDHAKSIKAVLNKAIELSSFEMGAVFLLAPGKKIFYVSEIKNMPAGLLEKLGDLESENGIGGFISKTLSPHLFQIEKYPSYLPHRNVFKSAGIKNISFIPLVAGERLTGMYLLCSRKEKTELRFTADLYTIIGSLLGNHLVHSKNFSEARSSAQSFSALLETSPDIFYKASPSGAFTLVSSRIEELTGYSRGEFSRIKELWLKLIHPDDKKYFLERITRLGEIRGRDEIEYRILPKGKAEYRLISDQIELYRDPEGNVSEILGTVVDLTDQRKYVKSLELENGFNNELLSSMPQGVVVIDDQLKCRYWNRNSAELLNIKSGEPYPADARSIFPFFEDLNFSAILDEVSQSSEPREMEHEWNDARNGSTRYLHLRFSPMPERDSGKSLTMLILNDISEQRKRENEVRESQHILTNVIDTMGDILILTNLQGGVVQVNRTFLNILGYTRMETSGCEFPYPWLVEEEMGRFVLWIASLREHNWLHDFDMTLRAKDGRLIPVSLSTTLLRNSMGEPIAMLNIARDITERKRLAQILESRNKQIELFNRIISKANQTFELREVFATIANEIMNLVQFDKITLSVFRDGAEIATSYSGTSSGLYGENELPLEKSFSKFIVEARTHLIVNDFQADETYKIAHEADADVRSHVGMPITLKDKIIGTLELSSKEPFAYADDHVTFLTPIVQQIGTIIDRILLFRQVSDDSSYIHNLLDSIDSVVYTVDTELRIREVNKAWRMFMREFGKAGIENYEGKHLYDLLPSDAVKYTLEGVAGKMLAGEMKIFSREIFYATNSGDRIHQLTVNPMEIGDRITGLVFTQTDITPLKNTEAELKRNNEQLVALNEISGIINSSLDFNKMADETILLFKRLMDADALALYLREEDSGDLVLIAQSGFPPDDQKRLSRLQGPNSASGLAVEGKSPISISGDLALDGRIEAGNRAILERLGLESAILSPIISNDKVMGVLDIFYTRAHAFTGKEHQLLELIGNHLGSAIQNARLYTEIRTQLELLKVLYEISRRLTSTLNIEEIFQTVYSQVRLVLPFQMFKMDLYDRSSNTKSPVIHVEKVGDEEIFVPTNSEATIVHPGSSLDKVIESGKSRYSDDRRTMFIPMLSKEILLGIISVESESDNIYTENQVKLMESIANLTAIALEKGKLYEETIQKSAEIERRNKELDDFTYVVSHDLKEPLISVEGFSKILQADYQALIKDEGKDYLDSIVGATTRMKGLIDDLLLLSRVSRPSESFKAVKIAEIIKEIQTDMEFTVKQRNVSFLIPDDLPSVRGNETQVRIVFRNLIGNAIKFNNKPDPLVEVKFQNTENNRYLFSIRDNGIGIEKEFYQKIFMIFQRLHRREEYEGSGAGLAIVKKIIEIHKGDIWVESSPGQGSTFFFTLPKFS